jgi:hypothetical protein
MNCIDTFLEAMSKEILDIAIDKKLLDLFNYPSEFA